MNKQGNKLIAVLFARKDSIYKTFTECDVYDINRNALTFKGGMPVIAHPPCRLWGKLGHFSSAPEEEKNLAIWSINQIRENGGVLEHPAASRLWPCMNLPQGGKFDKYGGWTLGLFQWWFGHKAEKKTRLYIVGIKPANIPDIPLKLGYPEYVVSTSKRKHSKRLKEITKKEREATPRLFAEWLVSLVLKIYEEQQNEK
jgi:hypothetical protein